RVDDATALHLHRALGTASAGGAVDSTRRAQRDKCHDHLGAMVSARVGIALSGDELLVSDESGLASRVALTGGINDRGYWPDLAEALRSIAGAGTGGTLGVTLLPPLVELVRVELPPLDDGATVQLLARNAGRYFVNARGTQTIGVLQRRGKRGEPSQVLA